VAHDEEGTMKVVHCECGTDLQGETDDEIVEAVEAHVRERHPDMEGQMSREQILGMAHDH
jgi:predicted small metal-binding protein